MKLLLATVLACAVYGQTETRTFRGVREVQLDNVNGPVEISGTGGDGVALEAVREVKVSDPEDQARADREVRLQVEESAGKVRIFVEYPQDSGRRRYSVRYTLRLGLPAGVKLSARTVNGSVKATFPSNPTSGVVLETVNGSVDATFQAGLNADVRTATLNGGVYTDFEVRPLAQAVKVDKVDGMTRYRQEGAAFRIGNGGPEFHLRTVNGSIFLRRRQK